jgi:NTP pyrophosphatase (non-canonical NTP hydrolase)
MKHRRHRVTTENLGNASARRLHFGELSQRMEFSLLSERAMEVRQRFTEASRLTGGRAWTREEVMQGFVGDVGDLAKLVMAKSGVRRVDDVDRKLRHELSDCLWSVLTLANLYDVNLEQEFLATMTEIEAKVTRQAIDT